MGKASMSLLVTTMLGFLVLCGPAWGSDPNLVAHWKFDETSGTTALDCVGDNNGTVHGATWTTGQVGGALEFDGLDDYVDVGNDPSLKPSLPVTLSAWIKLSGSGKFQRIVSTGEQVPTYYGVWLELLSTPHPSDKVHIGFGDGTGGASQAYRRSKFGASVLDTGRWYHVVGVVRGATDMDVYVDGVNDGGNYDGSGGSLAYSDGHSSIGYDDAPRFHFDGLIDDVRIYDRALSAEEIQELYLEGLSAYERAIIRIEDAAAKKEKVLEAIDKTLEKEEKACDDLEELLESGDYGDLKKGDIVTAKQRIHSAMQRQERSADALEGSIEKLYDALAALGWEPNLVSYWKFDEGSGTIAYDSVGSNHGTLFGDTVWTSSPIDGALSFDGDGDYVDCGNGASINNLTRFSVSLWFKADVIPSSSGDYFVSQRDLSSVVWTFILHGDFSGRVAGAVIADGSNAISTTDFIPNIGEWYHGAMTYDDLGDRKIRIYINGTEQSYLQHWPVSGTMASNPSVHVAIGNRIGGGRDFGGSIDEVMIFNRILSPEEIEQLYQDGLSKPGKGKGK